MRLILLTGLSILVMACGQKGPLDLPEADGAAAPAASCASCPPARQPAATTTDDADDTRKEKAATPVTSQETDQ